ncbi:MAG TPA: tyrosine-type recombinase/integrase [Solirubrobacterales bacterium]|nr:tyrosine-type recombinase/integrase [Solirubrobacterales bacterium]
MRKTFQSLAEAKSWRAEAKRAVDLGTLRTPSRKTLAQAAATWLSQAEAGEIRNRSGNAYKPATLRGYRQALDTYVLPVLGNRKLNTVTTADLQDLVDRWMAEGQAASTIRNSIKPLQAIYRRARSREGLPVNPTHDLELPAPRPREVEIVAPEEAARLLAAAPAQDRGLWATALYAGLRHGELRALRWNAVDLAGGTIRVRESWDPKEGSIAPKTRTSQRTTPMPALLRGHLMDRRLAAPDASDEALVFGVTARTPFQATVVYRRADKAWEKAGLGRLRLHQARHTYASFMIAAGVNAKALSAFMGHSSIKVTFDLYGHLMPGTEAEAAALLDRYLGAEVGVGEEVARGQVRGGCR